MQVIQVFDRAVTKAVTGYEVSEATGCWNWQGSCNAAGYGRRYYNGKLGYAHRFMWERANGIPPGHIVRQTCGNRRCVNLAHLVLVTRSECLFGRKPHTTPKSTTCAKCGGPRTYPAYSYCRPCASAYVRIRRQAKSLRSKEQ